MVLFWNSYRLFESDSPKLIDWLDQKMTWEDIKDYLYLTQELTLSIEEMWKGSEKSLV